MADFEVAIVGGGLAGMIAALSLARQSWKIALIAPRMSVQDGRTTALMDQSIRFLETLGLFDGIRSASTPLCTMQIIDGTDRLLRAPRAIFHAAEVGLEAFGYNIPNHALNDVLQKQIEQQPGITLFPVKAEKAILDQDHISISLETGEIITAKIGIAADGRHSLLRKAAGIEALEWSYPQSAMVLNFSHSLGHRHISTEFHTRHGPFTQVPMSGSRSGLVWVQKPAEADAKALLPLSDLGMLIEERMQSLLGQVKVESKPQVWPLSGMIAHRFGQDRMMLIGEAAHVFPPIGAQGLNLGIRDIMVLNEVLGAPDRHQSLDHIGDVFDRRRRVDITTRTIGIDALNRSLLSDFLPVQMARTAGLHFLSAFKPIRSLLMREGLEPGAGFDSVIAAIKGRHRDKSV